MKSWYEIKNATAPEAEVYLYDEIGGWGVSPDQFVKDLSKVKSSVINLYVNSPGGDAFGGMAIHAALERHPATVNAVVDGLAASSASFIIQAADRITMSKGATLMIHEPYGMTIGNAEDMAKQAEVLSKMGDNIAGIYQARAGGTESEWRQAMRNETWYRADEAVKAGLADTVAKSPTKMAAKAVFNLAKFGFQNVPEWLPVIQNDDMSQCCMPGCDMVGSVELNVCADHAAEMLGDGGSVGNILAADWTTAYVNNLPDSAFAVVKTGGEKDDEGKTTPRNLRMLPHHDSGGAVDLPHLRNAMSREPQADMTPAEHAHAKAHLDAHAKAEGVGEPAKPEDMYDIGAAIEEAVARVINQDDGLPDIDYGQVVEAALSSLGRK